MNNIFRLLFFKLLFFQIIAFLITYYFSKLLFSITENLLFGLLFFKIIVLQKFFFYFHFFFSLLPFFLWSANFVSFVHLPMWCVCLGLMILVLHTNTCNRMMHIELAPSLFFHRFDFGCTIPCSYLTTQIFTDWQTT